MLNFSKKPLILITLTLALGLYGCGKKIMVNNNTIQNQNQTINQDNNVSEEIKTLALEIEDWKKYKMISSGKNGIFYYDSCGDKEFDSFVNVVNKGKIFELKLNRALTLIYTPNYNNWTNAELKKHESFWEAGEIYPLYAYQDKILWSGTCGSGMKPDENTSAFYEFQNCETAGKALEYFLKNK